MEKLIPYKTFMSHKIQRRKGKVIFGCGSVTVNQSDLLLVAEYLELRKKYEYALKRLVNEWKNYRWAKGEEDIIKLGAKKLKKIAG